MNVLQQEIIKTIAKKGRIDESGIGLDSNLYDLGIDSLSSLEILSALEEKYDVRIPDEELGNTGSIRKIVEIVSKELK